MTASSSFTLLSTSKPPSFHSPLSDVYMDATRRLPCIDAASSFMNLTVRFSGVSYEELHGGELQKYAHRDAVEAPFQRFGTQALPLDMPSKGNKTLGGDVDVCISLRQGC